jgi:hypothetical protein
MLKLTGTTGCPATMFSVLNCNNPLSFVNEVSPIIKLVVVPVVNEVGP